jgi:colanic acid/amylovoran biosynthesis glycosyltransferase
MSSRIAYFVNQYPAISHTFIRREIEALERQGIDIQRSALRGWNADLVDAVDKVEQTKTHYVLRRGALPVLMSMIVLFLQRPIRFFRTLGIAWRTGWRGHRPLAYHLFALAEACALLQWLRHKQIDHVHAHFGTNSAEVLLYARLLGGPPYSFTVHGPEEFDDPQGFALKEKVEHADFVVAITSFARSQIFRWANFEDWHKVHVVRCGLSPEVLEQPRTPVPGSQRLVTVGRLVEQKGQKLLLEAAKELNRRGVDFYLTVIGNGPMRQQLGELITAYGLDDKVKLAGALSTEQLLAEIRASRAVVLPSFAEGLPMVIMEAMALGRPVLTTHIAGIPELVRHHHNGWLIAPGCVSALTEAMQEALATPAESLARMADQAVCSVRQNHSADHETLKLAQMFCKDTARSLESSTTLA